jgi:hypothetical protein
MSVIAILRQLSLKTEISLTNAAKLVRFCPPLRSPPEATSGLRRFTMRQPFLPFALVATLAYLFAGLPLSASDGTLVNFVYPGAYQTEACAINNSGVSVGFWSTGQPPTWAFGFVRRADGDLILVAVPGADATIPYAINGPGAVVGFYEDANYAYHGFLFSPDAGFTVLNAPGAGWRPYAGTYPLSINDAGQVAGFFTDNRQVQHGFLRDAAGNYSVFDPPDSVDTSGGFVNENGLVAGSYKTPDGTSHGYLRDSSGNITTFDVIGASTYGIYVGAINAAGEIAGDYGSTSGSTRGFLRTANGVITTFDLPAGTAQIVGIQDDGDIIGWDGNDPGPYSGLRRSFDGVLTFFSDPSAGRRQGTYPQNVSRDGKIAGYYVDSSNLAHAFIWLPN